MLLCSEMGTLETTRLQRCEPCAYGIHEGCGSLVGKRCRSNVRYDNPIADCEHGALSTGHLLLLCVRAATVIMHFYRNNIGGMFGDASKMASRDMVATRRRFGVCYGARLFRITFLTDLAF